MGKRKISKSLTRIEPMTFRTQSVVKSTELLEDSWSYFLGSFPLWIGNCLCAMIKKKVGNFILKVKDNKETAVIAYLL